ncbi:hypothetical protein LGV61_04760 [Desulfurispirillum indicum]|uniref:4Fe-4S ferredoxin-type domain-containing protein n=1 Tax=Desulfurispirillum indicum (strain ATCC BAA-1389 / DSM 22839 / S5) TaxID=653733 RepID=E6W2B7_DESIS|nr:hypothetical protein [Desulfurispirillum indicum]ADU65575.1 hypothetical protein Selin_0835 [Desulfurispirillum indicum S5]UCZ57593.1 hypothetical protein LGV61_04760 [Desulfurispirillum indicum]
MEVYRHPQPGTLSRRNSIHLLRHKGYLHTGEHQGLIVAREVPAMSVRVKLLCSGELPPADIHPHPCSNCVRCINRCPAKVIGSGLGGRRSLKCALYRWLLRCNQCFEACSQVIRP